MNAVFNLPRLIRLCGIVAIFSALAACGQRGPLYLPAPLMSKAPAKPVTPGTDQSTTAPAAQKPDADATTDSTQNTQQK